MQSDQRGARSGRRAGGARGDAKRVTGKYTLHLGVETWQRLGVHATLSGRDKSRLADEILTSHLTRYGRGREVFGGPLAASPREEMGERSEETDQDPSTLSSLHSTLSAKPPAP